MDLDKSILIVLANKDFRDEEYNTPRQAFDENGLSVKIAAADPDDCTGIGGTVVSPDFTFDEINSNEFDAILFVGGIGVESLFANDLALDLARQFNAEGKIVAAICWAPVILANAGLLKGKKATAWTGAQKDLAAKGAVYTGEVVCVDGNIVTASGPEAAEEFALKILNLLGL